MKRLLLVFVLLIFALPLGLAQNDTGVTEEDLQQASMMDTPPGAQVRLLQLERAVQRNIVVGQAAVETIEENTGQDASGLNDVLEKMASLKEEIGQLPSDGNASELAQEFVAIKAEARELTKQFRNVSRSMLSEEDRQQIQERARNRSQEMEHLHQQIREKTREYNAQRVQELGQRMGIDTSELSKKVRNGQMNTGEAVSQLGREYNGLGKEKKQEALARVNEMKTKREVNKNKIAEKAREKARERVKIARELGQNVREQVKGFEETPENNPKSNASKNVPGKAGGGVK